MSSTYDANISLFVPSKQEQSAYSPSEYILSDVSSRIVFPLSPEKNFFVVGHFLVNNGLAIEQRSLMLSTVIRYVQQYNASNSKKSCVIYTHVSKCQKFPLYLPGQFELSVDLFSNEFQLCRFQYTYFIIQKAVFNDKPNESKINPVETVNSNSGCIPVSSGNTRVIISFRTSLTVRESSASRSIELRSA